MKILISRSGISDIVYHATGTMKLVQMLHTGTLDLTPSSAIGADANVSTAPFFLSTTRSRQGHYHRDNRGNSVLLKLDGSKLRANYKGKAVDYWGPEYRKRDATRNEMEDRIFSNRNTIPILRYLIGIDMLTPTIPQKELNFIKLTAKKNGIELRFFANNKDWVLGRNPVEFSGELRDINTSDYDRYPREIHGEVYQSIKKGDARIAAYTKMLGLIKAGAIVSYDVPNSVYDTHDNSKEFTSIYREMHSIDGASSLGADMHNAARSQSQGERGQKKYRQLVALINMARSMHIQADAKSIFKFISDTMDRQRKEYKATLPQEDDGW